MLNIPTGYVHGRYHAVKPRQSESFFYWRNILKSAFIWHFDRDPNIIPLHAEIANQNSLFTRHDMLHYSLNVRPTLRMIWRLVMQQDKKSSHMFVFSVVKTAALTCQVCSKIISELIHGESPRAWFTCTRVCLCASSRRGSQHLYSDMTVLLNVTSRAAGLQRGIKDQQPRVTPTETNYWSRSCVENMLLIIFILLRDFLFGAPYFEILFIFTSWIFHTAWAFFLF